MQQQLPSGQNNQYQLVQNDRTRKLAFQSTGVLGYVPDKVTSGNIVTINPLTGQYGFQRNAKLGYIVRNPDLTQAPYNFNYQ